MRWPLALLLLARGRSCSDGACEDDTASLLVVRPPRAGGPGLAALEGFEKPASLEGKSVYFLMTDRFGRSGERAGDKDFCLNDSWQHGDVGIGGYCGGTFKGVEARLDYIQGMGFDCIWISPVVNATDYTGYFATNFFALNPHFGTEQDLKDLSQALHERSMCLIVDIVTNHVENLVSSWDPLTPNFKKDAVPMYPFDKGEYYHHLGAEKGQDLETYVKRGPLGNGPLSGTASMSNSSNGVLAAAVAKSAVKCGPENPELSYCSCMPGNRGPYCTWVWDQERTDGWFGAAGDLNQDVPFVKSRLVKYVRELQRDYRVDGFRLDTAIYQKTDFLHYLQSKIPVDILGEVTVNNLTFAGEFQNKSGQPILNGLLNFPPFYWMPESFCSYHLASPFGDYNGKNGHGKWTAAGDLRDFAHVVEHQLKGGMYGNLDLLGNFADNHDEYSRLAWYCKNDGQRIRNMLATLMLMRGIPIIYYGTEQGLQGHQYDGSKGMVEVRESLWQTGYDTSTWQYKFLASLNKARKQYGIGTGGMEFRVIKHSPHKLAFTRKAEKAFQVWVFVNNLEEGEGGPVDYCPDNGRGPNTKSCAWHDAFSGKAATFTGSCYNAPDAEPKLLVPTCTH